MEEQRGAVDGIDMRWLEAGAGVPVVMVHGIPTSAELWRRVLPAVDGARAMAWEMVGYGASIPAGRGRDISVARQADYLLSWLRAQGIDRAILAGHDLGGGVVQAVAVRSPLLCGGLVLTNAVAYDAWPVWPTKLVQRFHWLVARVPAFLAAPVFQAALRGLHEPGLAPESARIHWGHYARHGGATALVRQVRALDARDTRMIANGLPGIEAPARVVWGDADPFLDMAVARRLARDLGTEVRPIVGGRHYTPEDHPESIANAINELVREF